jgi:hypothetical protein
MARLIDSSTVVEIDPMVAGMPVIEFVEEINAEAEFFVVMPRKEGGARLDRSFQVTDWLEW